MSIAKSLTNTQHMELEPLCTVDDIACIFPFEHQGEIYIECTKSKLNRMKNNWCATAVDDDGKLIDGEFGVCESCISGPGSS